MNAAAVCANSQHLQARFAREHGPRVQALQAKLHRGERLDEADHGHLAALLEDALSARALAAAETACLGLYRRGTQDYARLMRHALLNERTAVVGDCRCDGVR
ncbi:hypothetical protein, partial [Thiohalocapsa marina]|uniref:hypothetical protein n=1 Tax=Thiohalocapsa marina TaxID=424902 RepID=UPI0014793527